MKNATQKNKLKRCAKLTWYCKPGSPSSNRVTLALFFGLAMLPLASQTLGQDQVGPLVGHVDSSSAHLLFRPGTLEQPLKLEVLDSSGSVVQQVNSQSESKHDYVAKFHVTDLTPATQYRYRILGMDEDKSKVLAEGPDYYFRTQSGKRRNTKATVCFTSCVDIETNPMWKGIRDQNPDGLFLMGDTPYIDNTDLAVVRQRHRAFLAMPELADLIRHTPTVGTWDDHDFGANNSNGLSLQKGKRATRQGFVEYRAHARYGTGDEGVFHRVDLGAIEVFLLDPRYFSQTEPSPVDPAQPTCFGREQWSWLLENLKASQAPFKVLAMGAIWQDKKNFETDDMFTYWYERDALLDFVAKERISGVVVLGGDIHVSRHLIHPLRTGYDLHDFIISPGHKRTITELDVYHPSLRWSLVEGQQFLSLTADTTQEDPKLIASFCQGSETTNREVVLKLSELTAQQETGIENGLRAHWSFDADYSNESRLGDRLDAKPHHQPEIVPHGGAIGGAVRFDRSQKQFLNVSANGLDDNSDRHTYSLWFRASSLPKHGTDEQAFLLQSTAEGQPSPKPAWHLSLGIRACDDPNKINLQLQTHTLEPAKKPGASPTAISQGAFDHLVARSMLNKWTHITCTFDSERLTLFIDGKQVASDPLPIPGPASEFGGLVLGGDRNGSSNHFHGLIDEVMFWERVLDSAEIALLSEPAKASQTESDKQ